MGATANIFDASIQKEVPHKLEVDQNGEIVATSTESDRSIKFPSGLTHAQFEKAIADHKKGTEGQQVISKEELEAREADLKKSNSLLEFYADGDK